MLSSVWPPTRPHNMTVFLSATLNYAAAGKFVGVISRRMRSGHYTWINRNQFNSYARNRSRLIPFFDLSVFSNDQTTTDSRWIALWRPVTKNANSDWKVRSIRKYGIEKKFEASFWLYPVRRCRAGHTTWCCQGKQRVDLQLKHAGHAGSWVAIIWQTLQIFDTISTENLK